MTDLIFHLENKIDFANRETGEPDKTMEITLRAPSYNGQKHYFRIYQHFSAAIMRMAQNRPDNANTSSGGTSEDVDGETALMIIAAGDGDLAKLVEDFGLLALDVGRFNDETPLLPAHLEQLSPNEMLRMCGAYLAFFVAPSLLSRTKKRGSSRS